MDEQLMEPPDVLSKKNKNKKKTKKKVHRMTQRSTTFSDKISIAYQVSGVVVI